MIFNAKITKKKEIALDTWEISISHKEDNFYFNAGQYIWVIIPSGRRAFSISSSSKDTKNFQIIFRENKKSEFKKYILDTKNVDISIRGPFGFLRAPTAGEKLIYIAGGVGIAPVLSIIRRMSQDNILADATLIFANISNEREFYIDELEKILNKKLIRISGKLAKNDIPYDLDTKYYILGTQKFVDEVSQILTENKIPSKNIIFEEKFPSVIEFDPSKDDKSYFKFAVDESLNHAVMTDLNGCIVYANKAAEVATGYTFSEMKGQTPRLWGGLMEKTIYDMLWKTIKIDKKPFLGELTNQRKNGDEYKVLAMISPIRDADGEMVGFLGVEQDITKFKQSEVTTTRLNELMIGRELKMAELKKENEALRKKVAV